MITSPPLNWGSTAYIQSSNVFIDIDLSHQFDSFMLVFFTGGFHCPEEGEEIFTKLSFPELDARNALKTASDYHGDGQRARKLGREDIPKKGRYDDGRDRNDRYGGEMNID